MSLQGIHRAGESAFTATVTTQQPPKAMPCGLCGTINVYGHTTGLSWLCWELTSSYRASELQSLTSVCHVHRFGQCLDIQPAVLDEGHRVCVCHIRTSQCLVVTPASWQHQARQNLVCPAAIPVNLMKSNYQVSQAPQVAGHHQLLTCKRMHAADQ